MTFGKSEVKLTYLDKMNQFIKNIEQFINGIHDALLTQTADKNERQRRLDVFNALLLKATHCEPAELKKAFAENFPSKEENPTIQYLRDKLCEINGFCTETFSDDHEGYQTIYHSISFLVPEQKAVIRAQLSHQLVELIFKKTNTEPVMSQKAPGCS